MVDFKALKNFLSASAPRLCRAPLLVSLSGTPVGLQGHIASIQDPKLRKRAASLPDLVHARWAVNTTSKYEQGWRRWSEWCQSHPESPPRPASPFYICLYINDLVLDNCKYGALTSASTGIRWGHLTCGMSNPMENDFVKVVLEGAKRTVGKPASQQKEPMTAEMTKHVVDFFGFGDSLLHKRSVVICLLGFSGFLRISELIEIQVKHLKFDSGHLEITIPKAKNNQMREGHIVHIAKTHTRYCPVQWLRDYLQETGLHSEEKTCVISTLAKTETGHRSHGSHPLSDTTVRDILNQDSAHLRENRSRCVLSPLPTTRESFRRHQQRHEWPAHREARALEVRFLERPISQRR